MIPQLDWLNEFFSCAQRAMWDQLKRMDIQPHVDPLKKLVVFTLSSPFTENTYNPFTSLLYGFARANNCYIETFRTTAGSTYTATLLIKRRIGPRSNKNPIRQELDDVDSRRDR